MGATSAIAEATARIFAQRGDSLYLVGRRVDRLESIAADLKVRGAAVVGVQAMDASDLAAHESMLVTAEQTLGALDTVLIAHGTLSDQKACETSAELTVHELTTNGVSVVALLTLIAQRFESRKSGTIAVISSVAGDRGRQNNYVYGSAKALVSAFLSGLRQRLSKSGVAVITIKPGFVDTPMTAALPHTPLYASAARVGGGIVRAVDSGRDGVVYLPWWWRFVMLVVKALPESVFKRLSF